MIIHNLEVKNKFIDIKNIKIDISSVGIFLIKGENGCGKTTIMEKIVFDNYDAQFVLENQKELFIQNRERLFSYVPQYNFSTDETMYECFTKKSNLINMKEIDELMKIFHMETIEPIRRIATLSGGEQMKIAIIRAIVKNTPYIFMDEPTNNMDEETVKSFIELIKKQALNKTIVIISHDKRIEEIANETIYVSKDVKQTKNSGIEKNNTMICENIRPNNFFWLILKALKSKRKYIFLFIILICLILEVMINTEICNRKLANNDLPNKDTILIYSVDNSYAELNKTYANGEGLDVPKENYYSMITYQNIYDIAKDDRIEKIYIHDIEKYNAFYYAVSNNLLLEKMNVFSLPIEIRKDSSYINMISDSMLNILDDGRLPYDNSSEISISKELLIKFYGYNSDNVKNAIGSYIKYNEKEYKIVGIQHFDVAIISYSKGDNYGIYEYDEDTYEEYKTTTIEYLEKKDAKKNVDSILIITKNNMEKNVLNELFIEYPANNYDSYYYTNIWDKSYNSNIYFGIYAINIAIGIVLEICLVIMLREQMQLDKNLLFDYEVFYFNKKKIQRSNILITMFDYFLIIISSLIFLFAYTNNKFFSMFIIEITLYYLGILILPLAIIKLNIKSKKSTKKE